MAERFIALLRGINVGGHNRIPMAELRDLCAGLGWTDVRTYIQSGNIMFSAADAPAALEAALEAGITAHFGFDIPVVVRTEADWRRYVSTNPFPGAAEEDARFVHLVLSKTPPPPDAAEQLELRGKAGERVAVVDDALWIHYAGGAGRSKLTPVLLDRTVGAPVTARNWRTVLKIAEMLDA